MTAQFYTGCERLLSATANGVYQGILVALLAGLILRWFVRTNAATRHAVWFGVLLFIAALIPAHLLLSFRPRPDIRAATTPPAPSVMAIATAQPIAGETSASPAPNTDFPGAQTDASDPAGIDGEPCFSFTLPQGELTGEGIGSKDLPGLPAAEKPWPRFTSLMLKPLSQNLETAISLPHSLCLCLVSVWVLLAGVRGGLIAARIAEVRRVKRTSIAPSAGLQTLFDKLRFSMETRRDVRLRISTTHRTAVVLGFLHPVVLLPAEMDNDANDGEVEHVLRHELAHVYRRDDWGNLAQQLIQSALFFHPAVWWISAKLSLEREIACDDHVLEASGRPRAYALTLANVASRMKNARPILAPGVSSNNSQLQQRITMILNTQRDRSPRLARSLLGFFTTTTAILAVLAIDAGPRLVLAQSPPGAPTASSPQADLAPPPPPSPDESAELASADTPDSSAESGPRIKPPLSGDSADAPAAPPQIDLAAPPHPPTPASAPVASVTAVAPVDLAPEAHVSVSVRHEKHMSIEERLDRIERTLEELQARDGRRGRNRNADAFPPKDDTFRPMPPGASIQVDPNFDFAFKRAAEDVKRAAAEARRAADEGQHAAEEGQRTAERAMRDIAKLNTKDFERMQEDLRNLQSEGPARELEALRGARESLQKQVQVLEQQIKRLEEDRNRARKLKLSHDRSGDSDEGPNHEKPDAE